MARRRRSIKRFESSRESVSPKPLVPTLVCGSYKGGVGKTTMSVAIAERAYDVGLKVLLVAVDPQMDAARRLGVKPSPGKISVVSDEGRGCLHLLTEGSNHLVNILYRDARYTADYDCVVVDTPVERRFGDLPGVQLWVPIDGADALRNAVAYLKSVPASTVVTAYPSRRGKLSDMEQLERILPHVVVVDMEVQDCDRVERAHRDHKSVWSISPRRGRVTSLLSVADAAARDLWASVPRSGRPSWSEPSSASEEGYFFKGWDV